MDDEIESRIARFSCRASVKAGDELTHDEILNLITRLEKCENPFLAHMEDPL